VCSSHFPRLVCNNNMMLISSETNISNRTRIYGINTHRKAGLLKQQTLITVCRLPTKENKLLFAISMFCIQYMYIYINSILERQHTYRYRYIYIYVSISTVYLYVHMYIYCRWGEICGYWFYTYDSCIFVY
jgi:hypothetical protein